MKKKRKFSSRINWNRMVAKTRQRPRLELPRCIPTPWGPIPLDKTLLCRRGGKIWELSELPHDFRLRSGDVIVI